MSENQNPKSRKWSKKLLLVATGFAALVVLFYTVEDWRGWRAWENFRHVWEAKGERFDLASVIPPAVPDDQNFALTPLVASTYASMINKTGHEIRPHDTNVVNRLNFDLGEVARNSDGLGNWAKGTISDLKPWQDYYRTLAATTNRFPIAPQAQSPAADVLLALSKFNPTVEELRAAARLPESRFPLEYDKECPAAILLPHLATLKNTARLLQVRALADLQNGETQKALDDVRLLLRLAEAVRTEPILISQLVRIAILQIALQPVYEGLANHLWSDAQLVELDTLLARENFLADYRTAMRGEMVLLQIGDIQYLRHHPDQIQNMGGGDDGGANEISAPGRFLSRLIPSGWFYQNQYRCARMMMEFFLPAADAKQRTVSPSFVHESDRALTVELKKTSPYNVLEKMLMPALSKAVTRFAYAQSATDMARTAIALERYRLARGSYPESLDALAPQFISAIPHDVIGGEPLKYRREADGQFILYSIGWNETDDDGTVVFSKGKTPNVDITQGDWVWKYPAK